VRQVLWELGAKEVPIVTAVGGPGAVVRTILLPKMTSQELQTALTFESEKYIPFKPEDTFLDFTILGDRPNGRMEVLLAAARKDLVNAHLDLLSQAGIVPYAVDLEPLALSNNWELIHSSPEARPPQQESGTVGLLHIGARGTILDFFSDSKLQFSREIPIGGDVFTQALSEALRLDVLEAEALKCNPLDRSAQVREALLPAWDEWFSQCRGSFDYYEDQLGHPLQRLVLSGGSSRLAGFREWIQENSGLPTEEEDPLKGLSADPAPDALEQNRICLGVAVGLAVRELT